MTTGGGGGACWSNDWYPIEKDADLGFPSSLVLRCIIISKLGKYGKSFSILSYK